MGPTTYIGADGKLVHVDLDPGVFRRNLPTALPIQADIGAFAAALCQVAASEGLHNPRGSELARAARAASPFDMPNHARDPRSPIAPHRAIADLQRAAGPHARFITDIGEHMLFCLHYLTARDPLAFHIQLNLGSMGSGIAGAVGLALAEPSRHVVCVCGDGGMQMLGMEALVALRERLPIVFAVFNDARYNMVHHGMKQIFGEAEAWAAPPIDFCGWSRAIGIPSARITAPGEITAELLAELMAGDGPTVLDIRIDRDLRIRGGGRVEALQHMSMLQDGR
jgi:acetolactate synthase-1/2/3 large subunit